MPVWCRKPSARAGQGMRWTESIGDVAYGAFIDGAPAWNPRAEFITGKVCGIQVETIADPRMKKLRQLDKLVDELAKGRPMEKILR